MALFGKKKSGDPEKSAELEAVTFVAQPEKATKWFTHARTMADGSNFETALVYYASGLRFDPANEDALQAMLQVGIKHAQQGGKKLPSKTTRSLEGPEPIDKMILSLTQWLGDIQNTTAAIKALEGMVKSEQSATGKFFASHVLGIVSRGKKPTKQQFVSIKDACRALESWDIALAAGQAAMALDPADGGLDHEIKDLSAQRAMAAGGYEEAAGKEGGFRQFVKDIDKHRELEEEESLAGVGGGSERVLERAREAFREAPDVAENVNRYGTLLRRDGSSHSLKTAEQVYLKGYKTTSEYRFRMIAGDIRIQRFKDRIRTVREEINAAPESSQPLPQRLEKLEQDLLEFEATEYSERAEKYPTDRRIRFHLGEVAMRQHDTETAMGCFQKAKDEPRLRAAAGHLLGRCFATEGWHSEAADEYRDVLSKIDATESDRELEIRYDLMVSLIEIGRRDESSEHAREALDICSGIARQDITYRDIRQKRREIDELVKSLS